MGVAAGDLLGNGYEDLAVANLTAQYAYLYANDGKGWFDDRSAASGLIAATRRCTGFGLGMLDYDNDGRLDLFMACGAVTTIEEQVRTGSLYPLAQPNILLHNSGQGRFEDVSSRAGRPFSRMEVGRSAAFGDIDNDSGPARLLTNNVGHRKPWIEFRMVGEKVGRDMLGTRVAVFRRNRPRFGVACMQMAATVPRVTRVFYSDWAMQPISQRFRPHWVSGRVEEWTGLPVRKYTTLREGSGVTKTAPTVP